ncbi:MAG: nucleoside phosphorylase [Anaerolineaceae bacterium]|nr:nucleoside phosphorylase [Anaerolineaceae bacterium]
MENNVPLLEFDPAPQAILEPFGRHALSGKVPRRAVLCFFQEVLSDLAAQGRLQYLGDLESEIGRNPFYRLEWEGTPLLVIHPGVGAPLAGAFLEELVGLQVGAFIACGGCGVLEAGVAAGHPLVVTAAVRDEGTSYHYLPAGREVAAHPLAIAALEDTLQGRGLEYRQVKSWTTDGIYRETAYKRALRLAEGCATVDMEASAFFAIAQYRGVILGQLMYGGDLVLPEGWDYRGWNQRRSTRELIFWLAVEACSRLPER